MDSRVVIEQAKGIIMAERHCTVEEAYAVLTKLADYSHSGIHDVASTLVASAAHHSPPASGRNGDQPGNPAEQARPQSRSLR
jgi:hypothetical protein